MSQVTEHNHYVPRGYLARWSTDGKTVWEYKIVVPHEKYPLWRRAPLREACARRNLYDSALPGLARDHFENWFNKEVETPAYAALDRLEGGQNPSQSDMEALVRFAVAQDLRTVKDSEHYEVWQTHAMPALLERIVQRAVKKYKPGASVAHRPEQGPSDEIPLIETKVTSDSDHVHIETSMLAGSTPWMQRTKRMVREFTPRVARERWHIIRPCEGRLWPTSDHPLVERHGSGARNAAADWPLPLEVSHASAELPGRAG